MRKSRAEKRGKIQIHNIILNFPALDFHVWKITAGNTKLLLSFITLFFLYPNKNHKYYKCEYFVSSKYLKKQIHAIEEVKKSDLPDE